MNKGADIVSLALLGKESRTVVVGGNAYFIKPPTIRQIAGIGKALGGSEIECDTIAALLRVMENSEGAAEALSWLVNGDDTMKDIFLDKRHDEVVNALEKGLELVGIRDFQRLSGLSRSVRTLIANPK